MKRTLIAITSLMLAAVAVAKPVAPADVKRAAQHFWNLTAMQRGELQPVDFPYEGIAFFVGEHAGFVLMSTSDAARPVLGYSTSGHLDLNNIPVQLQDFLNGYSEQIVMAEKQAVQPSEADRRRWNVLMAGGGMKGDGDVEPLLETLWDQDPYYNKYCPDGTVAGCAAIAQAQMMRFWKWPVIGKGSHSYVHGPHGKLSADFGSTIYQWDLMPDQLYGVTPTAQINATARLIYHVGVSLEMDYNSAYEGGSGAYGMVDDPNIPSINNSLRKYFRYNRNLKPIFKFQYNDSSWAATLIDELKLGRPIVYCGTSTSGGHAFVCDGYEQRADAPYFHFNFGWSGVGDGYFTVDDISPNVSPTGQVGQIYTFNMYNQALLDATPEYSMTVSDTVLYAKASGSSSELLFAANPQLDAPWSASSDQPWVSLVDTGFDAYGTLSVIAEANTTGAERRAHVVFTQGGESVVVEVVQTGFADDELCPLTVEMEGERGKGWRMGAYLSFESLTGYVYATAALASGSSGTTTVKVAPHDLNVVFHRGGGTDREINYKVKNQYDEVLVDVEYAYHNGGTHFVEWPCAHVGIDDVESTQVAVAPNPVTDRLSVSGLTVGDRLEVIDMTGRTLLSARAASSTLGLDFQAFAPGVYLLRVNGMMSGKVVKQ